ncbi:SDR family NAD(P)-dependent oxidoreductase [Nocardia sp. NPDC057227]|uniref:SDR family NAD(P)-dependent oxidoreductase n=1 Tax=Nocardia sp. NPDC057227 TaxID=3346056 RepID=UPI0036292D79
MHTLVMTGATGGIGRIAAEHMLTEPDLHLVVLARDPATVDPRATAIPADLRSLASIRTAAERITALLDSGDLPPLHGFAGNAGIQYTNATTTGEDGYEATFAVNVLANHLLLRLLEKRFTAPARIVLTGSDTHFGDLRHNLGLVPAPVWQDPATLARPAAFRRPASTAAGRTAYSTSKLAVQYLVHEWARRLPAGVDIVSYNPGFVPGTGLARNAGAFERLVARRALPALARTPLATDMTTAGAQLAAVLLGKVTAPTGGYIDRDREVRSSPESYDEQRERQLFAALEEFLA